MAEFKIIAGDFGQGVRGDVRVGKMYRVSAQGFSMPIPDHSSRTQHIGTGQIETLEIATAESLKKMAGSIGWGFLGGLALGPIGALAGVLAGGRKTEVTFLCQFKDGRKFLGQCDPNTYTSIQAAAFTIQRPAKAAPNPGGCLVIILVLLIFGGIGACLSGGKASHPATSPANHLNEPAVGLVTYLLTDDINGMLTQDQSSAVWPNVEALLGWLRLSWSLSAKSYEADYDANEIDADNKFKGKRILISGVVSTVSKDFSGEGYVILRGSGLMGVRAQLNENGIRSAALFKKGQHVDLVCEGSGQLMTVASLDNCESLAGYLDGLSPTLHDRAAAYLSGGEPLGKAAGLPIVNMYVIALHLPASSACLSGKRATCEAEFKSLSADNVQRSAIQAGTHAMFATLKKN